MHQQRAGGGEQQRAGSFVLDCAAAQGQDQSVAGGQAGDGLMLPLAEGGLAVAGEDFGDGHASLGLDHVVHVEEAPAQASGDERTDRGLARAHEAGEDDAAGRGGLWAGMDGIGRGFHSLSVIDCSGQLLSAGGVDVAFGESFN